jgi:hypothetical protein
MLCLAPNYAALGGGVRCVVLVWAQNTCHRSLSLGHHSPLAHCLYRALVLRRYASNQSIDVSAHLPTMTHVGSSGRIKTALNPLNPYTVCGGIEAPAGPAVVRHLTK